jgi:hypothetical protein
MTATPETRLAVALNNIAQMYARKARRALGDRYERRFTDPGEWRNPAIRQAMGSVIALTEITVTGPREIAATAPAGRNGYIWAYIGREALAAAAPTDRPCIITQTDPHTYTLTWK